MKTILVRLETEIQEANRIVGICRNEFTAALARSAAAEKDLQASIQWLEFLEKQKIALGEK